MQAKNGKAAALNLSFEGKCRRHSSRIGVTEPSHTHLPGSGYILIVDGLSRNGNSLRIRH